MYHQSMKELQTDYLDYYLLHSVGGGEGIKTFHDRYIDNMDYNRKETVVRPILEVNVKIADWVRFKGCLLYTSTCRLSK